MLERTIQEMGEIGYTEEHLKQIDFALKVFPQQARSIVFDNLVFSVETDATSFYSDSEEFTEYKCSLLLFSCLTADIKLFNFLITRGAEPAKIHFESNGAYEQYTALDYLIKSPDLLFAQKALYKVNIDVDHMEALLYKCIHYDFIDSFKVLYDLYPFNIRPLIQKVSAQSEIGWFLRSVGHVHLSNIVSLEKTSTRCPICYEHTDSSARLVCGHLFCENCISNWLEINLSCPLCRVEFN